MEEHGITAGLTKDYAGRWCKDFFRVVCDSERRTDWAQALPLIKQRIETSERELIRDFHLGLLVAQPGKDDVQRRLLGKWSFAYEGNVLETVNLALNPFDEHYIDRDLSRTGLTMAVITPGTGHFAVDKNLLRLTTERMVDHGFSLDMVCLTKMPLHSVPLFSYVTKKPKERVGTTPDLLYFDAHLSSATDVELTDCYCKCGQDELIQRYQNGSMRPSFPAPPINAFGRTGSSPGAKCTRSKCSVYWITT